MESEFKYDVAFSFCQEDENLAYEIADQLGDNVKCFIYSQKQRELVGKDGEIEFKKTFSEYSRVVIVLYREKYGNSPWTRIEEEAIRGRAYDKGYDFTLFVSLDKKIPIYLPKTRIWYNLERFGSKGTAATILSLINEQGGETIEISTKDKVERLQRKLEYKAKIENYRKSHEAIGNALKEVDKLFEIAENKSREVLNGLNYEFTKEERKFCRIFFRDFILEFSWHCSYANSLANSGLNIRFFDISPTRNLLKHYEYDFNKNISWENVWSLKNADNEEFKSEYLFEKHLKEHMDIIEKENFNFSKNRGPFFI